MPIRGCWGWIPDFYRRERREHKVGKPFTTKARRHKGGMGKHPTSNIQRPTGNLSGPPLPSPPPYGGGEGDWSSGLYGAGWAGGARWSQTAATGFDSARRGGGLAARMVRALRRGRRSHPTAARRRRYVGNGDGAARRPYLYAGSAKSKSPKVSTEHLQHPLAN